jgi:N-acetylmuramoyl-L-alanine amidase
MTTIFQVLSKLENGCKLKGAIMEIIDYPSPNFFTGGDKIQGIVLHGTAGPLKASLAVLTNPRVDKPELAVSSNYLIDTNGDIYRLVPWWLGRRAYANGIINQPDMSVKWLAACVGARKNPNMMTISIEHVASYSNMISHGRMTDAQWNSSFELVKQLLRDNGLTASEQTILGHYQIDLKNKPFCPGVINIPAYINALNGIY